MSTVVPTEKEMREAEVPRIQAPEELSAYIAGLVKREHDYGTCVYAMSMAATAAFNYVAHELGVTGFQASCADMDIIRRTRSMKGPFAFIDGENMLYPQYDIPGKVMEYLFEWREWAAREAGKLLDERGTEGQAHPDVIAHWKRLAGR